MVTQVAKTGGRGRGRGPLRTERPPGLALALVAC